MTKKQTQLTQEAALQQQAQTWEDFKVAVVFTSGAANLYAVIWVMTAITLV